MLGRIITEALLFSCKLVRREGRLVWTGELYAGVNCANAINTLS